MREDTFNGDDAKLVRSIDALLSLDASGSLFPHGLGGHARTLLTSAAARLITRAEGRPSPEGEEGSTVIDLCASLAAAISLLERGGKAVKKAAPSDKMFDQMLDDYRASLERARAALSTPSPERAEGAPAGEMVRDISGETVCGFRVAAYRETHPEHGDKFGHRYSEHWSTPSQNPAVTVERLFTEQQLRAALSQPSQVGKEEADALRAEVLTIFKANKMASDERLAILIAERLAPRLNTPAPAAEPVAWQLNGMQPLRFPEDFHESFHGLSAEDLFAEGWLPLYASPPRDLGVSKADREEIARDVFRVLHPLENWNDFDDRYEARGGYHPMQLQAFDVTDAILAKLSPGEEGWRPIESAPSQEPVLVGHVGFKGWQRIAIKNALGEWSYYDRPWLQQDPLDQPPTHWMPLPPPPSSQEEGA